MLNIKTIFIILLALLPSISISATDQSRYKIEALVFKSLSAYESNEIWPTESGVLDKADESKSQSMASQSEIVQTRSTSDNKSELEDIRERMEESGEYIVLDYRKWQQMADSRSQSPVTAYDSRYENIGQLKGRIQFYMSRFLHISVDLSLVPEHYSITETESGQTGRPFYQIQQDKRIKSKNIYYFDHPEFGVLVYIHPS
jgi:hypothetical protein